VTTTTTTHTVRGAELRAQIVQREFSDRYPRGACVDYVHDAVDALPARVRDLIAQGHPRSAEYWLLQAERAAGVLTVDAFERYVSALGPFHLQSHLDGCTCAPGACLS
jgi:hypothetical protein